MTHRSFPIRRLTSLPKLLVEIPDRPNLLYIQGEFPDSAMYRFLAVVGSRRYTPYGRQVCENLIAGLRGYPVVIVSGLALGIDGIAHQTALACGITTVAVPGSGLHPQVLYPATHRALAQSILDANGALISEFEPHWRARPESFPQRNRIMAGMSHAVLVVEAEERSGTMITSRLALEYNRDVFAVPGPIHSATSRGPHALIQRGAALIQSSKDIIEALGLSERVSRTTHTLPLDVSDEEARVLSFLDQPMPRDELVRALGLPTAQASIVLSSLELKGLLTERMGNVERTS